MKKNNQPNKKNRKPASPWKESGEEKLVDKILAGDMNSYTLIIGKYECYIFSYLFHKMGDYKDASELTKETFLRAYCNLYKYNKEKSGSLLRWLYIVANACIDKYKKDQ